MTATQPTATEVIRVMRIEKIISLHYKDGFGTEEYSWSRGFFNTSGVALAPRARALSHADAVLDGLSVSNGYVNINGACGAGVLLTAGTIRNSLIVCVGLGGLVVVHDAAGISRALPPLHSLGHAGGNSILLVRHARYASRPRAGWTVRAEPRTRAATGPRPSLAVATGCGYAPIPDGHRRHDPHHGTVLSA